MSLPTTPALLEDDQEYNSAEDDDFDPTAVAATAAPDTDSDSDPGEPPSSSRKKRKRRGSDESAASLGDDSGGEGGFIKTRAQRAREGHERPRPAVLAGESTADVDELWRQMNSKPAKPVSPPSPPQPPLQTPSGTEGGKTDISKDDTKPAAVAAAATTAEGEETITISRTYTFAGTTHTELKTVPRSSQEARTYLANISSNPSHSAAAAAAPAGSALPPRRPPPKKRASVFDAAAAARKPAAQAPAQKLNTLEKSRLDWAGFVDKEGIGEELKKHTRGDKAYLDRQAFLGRVEENRDRAWKEGQKK